MVRELLSGMGFDRTVKRSRATEVPVMDHDDLPILGQPDVELEAVGSQP